MLNNPNIILLLIIVVIINSFFIGYVLGRFLQNGVSNDKPKSFFKQQDSSPKENNSISIDDKRFVVDIKTDGLEKKFNSLGDLRTTDEDISSSINKLKNLKR